MATAFVQKAAYGLWGWASLWTEGTWNDLVNSPVEPMLAGRFHAPWLRRSCKKRRTGWASLWTEGTWNDLVNSPVEPMLAGRFHAPWLRRSCKKRRTGCGAGPAC